MKATQQRFTIKLLIISIALYGVLYFIFSKLIVADMPLLLMVFLLFVVNSFAFLLVTNTKEKKPRSFVYSYMMVSLGRLIICAAFVFSWALTHRPDARTFALTFFLLYFIYNIVEIRGIYGFFKQ